MAQECPQCGIVSPPGARRCDCGHDFVTGLGSSLTNKQPMSARALYTWVGSFAFLQAAFGFVFAETANAISSFIDAGLTTTLAVATLKRQPWGIYGLAVVSIWSIIARLMGVVVLGGGLQTWVIPPLVYGLSAWKLYAGGRRS